MNNSTSTAFDTVALNNIYIYWYLFSSSLQSFLYGGSSSLQLWVAGSNNMGQHVQTSLGSSITAIQWFPADFGHGLKWCDGYTIKVMFLIWHKCALHEYLKGLQTGLIWASHQ